MSSIICFQPLFQSAEGADEGLALKLESNAPLLALFEPIFSSFIRRIKLD